MEIPPGALPITIYNAESRERLYSSYCESVEDVKKLVESYPWPHLLVVQCV